MAPKSIISRITRWHLLAALWTFALGVALSYSPPEITKVTLADPPKCAPNGRIVYATDAQRLIICVGGEWATAQESLVGPQQQTTGHCVSRNEDGHLVSAPFACGASEQAEPMPHAVISPVLTTGWTQVTVATASQVTSSMVAGSEWQEYFRTGDPKHMKQAIAETEREYNAKKPKKK